MFNRKEVKKRGMELIKGNLLFFFIMFLLTIGTAFIPFAGILGIIFISYFVIRNSLKICSGIESNSSDWFDFDSKSFVTLFIQYLLFGPILLGFILICTILLVILTFMLGLNGVFIDLNIFILLIIPFFLLMIPFFLLMHYFYFCQYIAVEYPAVGPLNSIKLSYKLTKGNLMQLVMFSLSFILWWLLNCVTFGIATFFVNGYVVLSTTSLYNEFKSKSTVFNEEISKYGY